MVPSPAYRSTPPLSFRDAPRLGRRPGIHNHEWGLWIPGSRCGRPGMTAGLHDMPVVVDGGEKRVGADLIGQGNIRRRARGAVRARESGEAADGRTVRKMLRRCGGFKT